MKCFCTSCGRGSEFFGEKNRPKFCKFCNFSFSVFQSEASVSENPSTNKNHDNGGVFFLEGEKYDKSLFLDAITISYEKDYR